MHKKFLTVIVLMSLCVTPSYANDTSWRELFASANKSYESSDWLAAEKAAVEAEKLCAQELPGSLEQAQCLDLLARIYHKRDEFSQAENNLSQVVTIYSDRLGQTDPRTVASMRALAKESTFAEHYAQAESWLRKANKAASGLMDSGQGSRRHLLKCAVDLSDLALQDYEAYMQRMIAPAAGDHHQTQRNTSLISIYHQAEQLRKGNEKTALAELLTKKLQEFGPELDIAKPADADILSAICMIARRAGVQLELMPFFARALQLQVELHGKYHPATLQTCMEMGLYLDLLNGDSAALRSWIHARIPKLVNFVSPDLVGKESVSQKDMMELERVAASTGDTAFVLRWLEDLMLPVAYQHAYHGQLRAYNGARDCATVVDRIDEKLEGARHKIPDRRLALGNLYRELKEPVWARKSLEMALKLAGNEFSRIGCECFLARAELELQLGNCEECRLLVGKCKTRAAKYPDIDRRAQELMCKCLARMYDSAAVSPRCSEHQRRKLLHEALFAARKLISIWSETDRHETRELASTLSLYGNLLREAGDWRNADAVLSKSERILRRCIVTDPLAQEDLADACLSIGELSLLMYKSNRNDRHAKRAEALLLESLRLATNKDDFEERLEKIRTIIDLSTLYKLSGNDREMQARVAEAAREIEALSSHAADELLFSDQYFFIRRLNDLVARLIALSNSEHFGDLYDHLLGWKGFLIESRATDHVRLRLSQAGRTTTDPKNNSHRAMIAALVSRFGQLTEEQRAMLAQRVQGYQVSQSYIATVASLTRELNVANDHLKALLKQNELLKAALGKLEPKYVHQSAKCASSSTSLANFRNNGRGGASLPGRAWPAPTTVLLFRKRHSNTALQKSPQAVGAAHSMTFTGRRSLQAPSSNRKVFVKFKQERNYVASSTIKDRLRAQDNVALSAQKASGIEATDKPLPQKQQSAHVTTAERSMGDGQREHLIRYLKLADELSGIRRGMCKYSDFQQKLSAGEVLVDFCVYTPLSRDRRKLFDSPWYGAVALSRTHDPCLIPLLPTHKIDVAINTWLARIQEAPLFARGTREVLLPLDDKNRISAHPSDSQSDLTPSDKRTISQLWQPVERILKEWRVWPAASAEPSTQHLRLLISPDGELARLPWTLILPAQNEHFLVAQVDSPRELYTLRRHERKARSSPLALLVGDIDFGAESLKHSKPEIDTIGHLLEHSGYKVSKLTRDTPTRTTVRPQLESASICHLATHGYFADVSGGGDGTTAVGNVRGLSRASFGTFSGAPLSVQNPFFWSGIRLYEKPGWSNSSWNGDHEEDNAGIFMAEDFVSVDLSGCDLVTLSACETGRGMHYTGQGVLGLRSAIMAAGARSVLMSLWSVDDEATSVLMQHFYSKLLSGDKTMTKARALAEAQSEVRNMPGKRWSDPYYWAGWTLCGQCW